MYGRLKDCPVYLINQLRGRDRRRPITPHASRVCSATISLLKFESWNKIHTRSFVSIEDWLVVLSRFPQSVLRLMGNRGAVGQISWAE